MENEALAKAFGKVVRRRRAALGFSQEGFAFECGLHRTFMGVIEQGKRNVSMATLFKIAAGLKTSASDLVAEVEGEISASLNYK